MGQLLPSIEECLLNAAQSLQVRVIESIDIVATLDDATMRAVGEASDTQLDVKVEITAKDESQATWASPLV
jgi:hypothetical protein